MKAHHRMRHFTYLLAILLVAAAAPSAPLAAQGKPLTVDDYARWRQIQGEAISPDGRWVAYTLRHTNTLPADSKPVLMLRDLETGRDVEIANAHDGVFSPDSRWVVYQVDSVPAARRARGAEGPGAAAVDSMPADSAATGSPPSQPPRVEVRELTTGATRSWQRMQPGVFNATATHLLLRRRAERSGRNGGDGGGSAGTDVVLHDLASGRDLFLGSVGDVAFNRQGDLLAYAIESSPRDGNGLFVVELDGLSIRPLDNDTLIYGRLAWSDDGERLAALKGLPVEDMRERDNRLVAFSNLRARAGEALAALNPDAPGFPEGFVISERAGLEWSEDAARVFFGILQQTPAPDTGRAPSRDSVADVDVWRTTDERVQSVQREQAERDRNFTFRQAFDVAAGRYVTLTDSAMRTVQITPDGRWAVGYDNRAYVADTARARADLYRVDTSTGERTLMLEGQLVGQHAPGLSPDGRRFLYWSESRYHAYDLSAGEARALPGGEDGVFVDTEWDYVGPRPPYGVAGFAADGSGVVVESRYDLWLLPYCGGAARNLTAGEGTEREVRLRWLRTEPVDSTAPRSVRTGRLIDLDRPVTLAAYGQWTKKAGFFRLSPVGVLDELVWADARFGTPTRAERAERFLLTRETFAEFPDLQVAGPAFQDMRKISDANPQKSEYMWGRRVLFDYTNRDGVRLQGILALPDDYVAGERRPMLVSFYEKNSQNLHRHEPPTYLRGMGFIPVEALSRGYITMFADVHFRTGSSHSDMLDAVEAATRKVIELGYADPDRIGVHGHSYGGEGAAYIGTRSSMFAAVGMGAGVTDITSDFNQPWGWTYRIPGGSGAPGANYYLYGQGRWGTDPWRDPELFRMESATTHAPNATAPFLIMHGTADPTVSFSEGLNFFNALRFHGKEAYLLAYPDEGHGLRNLANQKDLTVRYFDFFDHHLKGEPAPAWMTDGVPFLVKERLRDS
jgi:dipeptidyl aminopeptidase/acylaminoacyl peptidase